MINRFKEKKTDFETIVKGLEKEKNVIRISGKSVIYKSSSLGEKVPPKQLEKYREFMNELGLQEIRMGSPNTIRFVASSIGWLLISSEKSYVYSTIDKSPVADSLDEIIRSKRFEDQPPIYRRISPKWYLFYESW